MRLLTVLVIASGGLFLSGCEALGCDSVPTTHTIHMIATPTNSSQGVAPQKVELTMVYFVL